MTVESPVPSEHSRRSGAAGGTHRHDRAVVEHLPGTHDVPDAGRADRRQRPLHPYPVARVGLDDTSDAQFDTAGMEAAAVLLATAGVDVIAWNGTAGSGWAPAHDRAITDAITAATGVPALTSTQAYLAAFGALDVRSLGIVTPYPDDMNARSASATSTRASR